eukprot:scpid80109/ scgid24039/ 
MAPNIDRSCFREVSLRNGLQPAQLRWDGGISSQQTAILCVDRLGPLLGKKAQSNAHGHHAGAACCSDGCSLGVMLVMFDASGWWQEARVCWGARWWELVLYSESYLSLTFLLLWLLSFLSLLLQR